MSVDYKELFEQAIFHLRCVSGSRNSFAAEVTDRLYMGEKPIGNLRTDGVEKMHREAVNFLRQHDK